MRVYSALFSASAALGLVRASADEANLNGWYPCDVSQNIDFVGETDASEMLFECGEVEVPLCHEGICESDETIALFVKRLPATSESSDATATPKSMWVLQGGPGASSLNMERAMLSLFSHLNETVNIYTTDHRGTGRSSYLQCDAAQAFTSGSPWGIQLSPNEVPGCVRDVLHQIDGNPVAFSVTSAAKDIEYLINGLNAGEDVYLYGASYGTYWSERVMHFAPDLVKGYILDGVVTEDDPTFTALDVNIPKPTKSLAKYCEKDATCAKMFGSITTEKAGVYETWQAILDELDNTEPGVNQCADLFRVRALGEDRVSTAIKASLQSFRGDLEWRRVLPTILYLLYRCQDDLDLQTIQSLLDNKGGAVTSAPPSSSLDGEGTRRLQDGEPQAVNVLADSSSILHFVIKASEMWAATPPSWEEHMEAYHDTVFPSGMTIDYLLTCLFRGNLTDPTCSVLSVASEEYGEDYTDIEPLAFVYETDKYFGKLATIPKHASALIINGKLDYNTPSVGGTRQYENMKGGHGKMMVDMDFGGHCVGISRTTLEDDTECGFRIMASYVAADGNVGDVDTSCMKELPTMKFFSPEELMGGE